MQGWPDSARPSREARYLEPLRVFSAQDGFGARHSLEVLFWTPFQTRGCGAPQATWGQQTSGRLCEPAQGAGLQPQVQMHRRVWEGVAAETTLRAQSRDPQVRFRSIAEGVPPPVRNVLWRPQFGQESNGNGSVRRRLRPIV